MWTRCAKRGPVAWPCRACEVCLPRRFSLRRDRVSAPFLIPVPPLRGIPVPLLWSPLRLSAGISRSIAVPSFSRFTAADSHVAPPAVLLRSRGLPAVASSCSFDSGPRASFWGTFALVTELFPPITRSGFLVGDFPCEVLDTGLSPLMELSPLPTPSTAILPPASACK